MNRNVEGCSRRARFIEKRLSVVSIGGGALRSKSIGNVDVRSFANKLLRLLAKSIRYAVWLFVILHAMRFFWEDLVHNSIWAWGFDRIKIVLGASCRELG